MTWQVIEADCVEAMREMNEASVDAIVTDPPYGLEFMGKEWDRLWDSREDGEGQKEEGYVGSDGVRRTKTTAFSQHTSRGPTFVAGKTAQEWHQAWATEALRVLKPGGHLLAFGGTRTYHRLACAVEDAGFEIRDSVIWLYGSGFPKSLDVGKAIDKRPGAKSHEAFKRHLLEQREAKGLSRADVSEAVVGTRSGACWNWEHHQFPEFKWWPKLRDLLDLDPKWEAVLAEAEREKVGEKALTKMNPYAFEDGHAGTVDLTAPATPEAQRWQGWGTALKPAHEPVVVARKPLIGTVAQNVSEFGIGALNIDGCRIDGAGAEAGRERHGGGVNDKYAQDEWTRENAATMGSGPMPAGRWPANVALSHLPECERVGERRVKGISGGTGNHDGAVYGARTNQGEKVKDYADPDGLETVEAWRCAPGCPVAELDRQSGERRSAGVYDQAPHDLGFQAGGRGVVTETYADRGGSSRFFYTAKASRAERNAGLEGFEEREAHKLDGGDFRPEGRNLTSKGLRHQNNHPTVKPVDLMRWLCRLVTPPEGRILDCFAGSGTTGIAAILEGFDFVGIEREPEYVEIAKARIAWWDTHKDRAEEILALSSKSERERAEHEAAGQMGMFDG